MKIAHVSFSKTGGAGEVASELAKSQRDLGFDSCAIFLVNRGIASEIFRHPVMFAAAILDFRIRTDSKGQLFTLFRNLLSSKQIERVLKQFDVINLHWTPGMLSTKAISALTCGANKKIVWTLHDMRPLTGGCHHAGKCREFENECRSCPQVNYFFRSMVARNFSKHVERLLRIENLLIVSPSLWISNLAKTSRSLSHLEHVVIPNPVDCKVFHPLTRKSGIKNLHLDEINVGLCATNLSDSKKNVKGAIEIVGRFREAYQNQNVNLILIGGNPPADLPSFVKLLGVVNEKRQLAAHYQEMDVYLTLSLEENFPNTLIESQACGVPAICLNRGGMPEIVLDGLSGFVVNNDEEAYEALVEMLIGGEYDNFVKVSRSHIVENFSTEQIAMKYIADAYQLI